MFPIHFAKLSEPSVNDGILVMIKEEIETQRTTKRATLDVLRCFRLMISYWREEERLTSAGRCKALIETENKWPAALSFFGCRPHDMIQIIILFPFIPSYTWCDFLIYFFSILYHKFPWLILFEVSLSLARSYSLLWFSDSSSWFLLLIDDIVSYSRGVSKSWKKTENWESREGMRKRKIRPIVSWYTIFMPSSCLHFSYFRFLQLLALLDALLDAAATKAL